MSKNSHNSNFKSLMEWMISKKLVVLTPIGYVQTKVKKYKIDEDK